MRSPELLVCVMILDQLLPEAALINAITIGEKGKFLYRSLKKFHPLNLNTAWGTKICSLFDRVHHAGKYDIFFVMQLLT
jgi:hypothetical protein